MSRPRQPSSRMSSTATAGFIGIAALLILLSGQFHSGALAPGSRLYAFKLYEQRVNAWFAANPIEQAKEYAQLAEMRYADYKALLKKGDTEAAAGRAKDIEADLAAAADRLKVAKDQKVDVRALVGDLDRRAAERLEEFRAKFPQAKSFEDLRVKLRSLLDT
jgi:hypothetical protein